MNSKNFNTLAVVTVALVVISIILGSQSRAVEIGFSRGQLLVSFLDVDKVSRIELKKGDKLVQLQRGAVDSWVVENRNSYPADVGKIFNLFNNVMKIECMREVADTKSAHAELGVTEDDKDALKIKFLDGDKVVGGVVIGKEADKGEYARRIDGDEVYVTGAKVYIEDAPLDYVERTLSKLDSDQIARVVLSGNDKTYEIRKGKDGPKLDGVPEGMVAKGGIAQRIHGAAANLNFSDFQSQADAKELEDLFKSTYLVVMETGAEYTFKLAKKDDKHYCKASAVYKGPKALDPEMVEKGKTDPEIQKKNEAQMQAPDKVAKFNARHQSWVYQLDSWNAENMAMAFKDAIEEDKAFFKIEDAAIAKVEVKTTDKPYVIESPKANEINLVGVPEGKKPKGFDHHLVFSAAKNLSWDEHKKPEDEALKDVKFDKSYSMTLRDGGRYTFEFGSKDNQHWIKTKAEFTENADAKAAEAAKAAVAKYNERHGARVYRAFSIDNFTRKFDDMLIAADAKPSEIEGSHILIQYKGIADAKATRTKEEARKLIEDLRAQLMADPSKFAEMAKKHSEGPSAPKGGELGRFGQDGPMVKPFNDAAFELKVGEISGVVETQFGFHLIQRTK